MLWIEPKTIYVLYGDGAHPHWRGFGRLWQDNVTPLDTMARIGWADIPWEIPYTIIMQNGADGTLFMSDLYNNLFALSPNGGRWAIIPATTAINPALPYVLPLPQLP